MTKLLKVARKRAEFSSFVEQNLYNFHQSRLVKIVCFCFFINHLAACFWYLLATLEVDVWQTWLGQKDLVDSPSPYQYFNAFYWAFQTTTTVGYGDFSIQTEFEYVFAIFWMILGTNLFTFVVGSVSSLITDLEQGQNHLNFKIAAMSKYAKSVKLPRRTYDAVTTFMIN